MSFLLDTNVISELTRPAPDEAVVAFLGREDDLYFSSVTVHELAFGIGLMPKGKRRDAIARTVLDFIDTYEDRLIVVGRREAVAAADLRVAARNGGRTIPLADGLIAGVAKSRSMTVVTRNVSDFEGLGVDILDPWQD